MKTNKKILMKNTFAFRFNSYAAGYLSVASFNNQTISFEKMDTDFLIITTAVIVISFLFVVAVNKMKAASKSSLTIN